MIDEITQNLQMGADISIELNTKFFGIDCKIYYPKSTGHYSGKHDDIEYDEDPNEELKLLIPDVYNIRRSPLGGISDNLFTEEFILFAKHDLFLPYLTKIVATSDKLGTFQFIVNNSDSVTTMIDSIYKEVSLAPFMSFRNNDIDVEMNNEDHAENMRDQFDDAEASDDQSIKNSVPDSERVKYIYKKLE